MSFDKQFIPLWIVMGFMILMSLLSSLYQL